MTLLHKYKHYCTYTVERGLEEYEVEVEFVVENWGSPAQLYGPPENCWPAEPVEGYINAAFIPAPPWAKDKYPYGEIIFALTDDERWKLEERIICEDPPEYLEPDWD